MKNFKRARIFNKCYPMVLSQPHHQKDHDYFYMLLNLICGEIYSIIKTLSVPIYIDLSLIHT